MRRLTSILLSFCLVTACLGQIGRRSDPFATASIEGTSVGDKTPLTYLGISPTGETLPTASSLAIQDNSTSGNLVYIKSSPGSNSSATMLQIEADGSNWNTNNALVFITSDDLTPTPFLIHEQGQEIFTITSTSGIRIKNGITLIAGGTITSSSGGDVTLSPNSAGQINLAAPVIIDVNVISTDIVSFDTHGGNIIDSSGGSITGTLADGTTVGQRVWFVCKTAGNNIDITVGSHVTSDPEVIRLDAAKEGFALWWDGTDWVESGDGGQSYP